MHIESINAKKHILTFIFFYSLFLFICIAVQFPLNCHARGYPVRKTGDYYPSGPYYNDSSYEGPLLRLSLGYGIPYGFLGLNGEFMLFDYISISGGMGYSPGGSSWITGVRVYMNEPEKHFRPRISTFYGTVSVLSKKYYNEETYENDQGYAYGLGFEWKVLNPSKYSIDFDIILTDYNVPPGYEKKGPEIKFSLGFGRIF
ncbi:MAG: hypothetical protein ACMUHX_01335 [bacterium]